jgi:hypothetical protein
MSHSLGNHTPQKNDWLAELAAEDAPPPTPVPLPTRTDEGGPLVPAPVTAGQQAGSWMNAVLDRGDPHSRSQPQPAVPVESTSPEPARPKPVVPSSRRGKVAVVLLAGIVLLQSMGTAGYFLSAPKQDQPKPGTDQPVSPAAHPPAVVQEVIVSPHGEGAYRTLGEAIRKVEAGTRIRVKPGTYRESVAIEKSVHIVGDGPADQIVIESVGDSCLTMRTSFATVCGLTLKNRAPRTQGKAFAVYVPQGQLVLENCDISGDSIGCIGIDGESARPIIRRSKVHDSTHVGVTASNKATGVLEDCELFGHTEVALFIQTEANPVLVRCTIRDTKGVGVGIADKGFGLFTHCKIKGSEKANVLITGKSQPTLRDCAICDGKSNGVVFHESGGELVRCDLFGHAMPALVVKSEANPLVRGCTIRKNKDDAVLVKAKGRGVFHQCTIEDNGDYGICVEDSSEPLFVQTSVMRNNIGIALSGQCKVHAHQCNLANNRKSAWQVALGCAVLGAGNTPAPPGAAPFGSPAPTVPGQGNKTAPNSPR